jgi:hypothetical protein
VQSVVVVVDDVVVVVVVLVPHTFGVPPPPHVAGVVQSPQLTIVPQSSVNVPQLKPSLAHVWVGVQPQTLAVPPPPQVCGAVQVPQSSVKPVQSPLGMVPQFFPCAAQVVGVQQMPKSAAPCRTVGFMQLRLQQLMFVWHCWPSRLPQSWARTARGQTANRASRATKATGAISDVQARLIYHSSCPLAPARRL